MNLDRVLKLNDEATKFMQKIHEQYCMDYEAYKNGVADTIHYITECVMREYPMQKQNGVCPICDKTVPDGSKYCSNCGQRIKES